METNLTGFKYSYCQDMIESYCMDIGYIAIEKHLLEIKFFIGVCVLLTLYIALWGGYKNGKN